MAVDLPIPVDSAQIAQVCRAHQVARLSLFGSVVRDDFGPDSDVDVLVEFDRSARIGLMELARLQLDLASVLGREVHLSTPRSLSRYFRDDVVQSAVPVYVAA